MPFVPTGLSPYTSFSAAAWSELRAATPLSLSEDDLNQLRGLNVALSLDEVRTIYLPLSRLLNLYVGAAQELYRASDTFLGKLPAKVPFVIGVAGSVAVGKIHDIPGSSDPSQPLAQPPPGRTGHHRRLSVPQ